jgi:hypothetical protein
MDEITYFSGEVKFCFCGIPAIKEFKPGIYLCKRHNEPIEAKIKRGRFSGISKTPFGNYEDR